MAGFGNNVFFVNEGDWLDAATPPGEAEVEAYLAGDEARPSDEDLTPALPDVIGILPIRNTVAYPGTVTPLTIGRERSKTLLADTVPNESLIGLLTQRSPETDRPGFGQLYRVGTAASVLRPCFFSTSATSFGAESAGLVS